MRRVRIIEITYAADQCLQNILLLYYAVHIYCTYYRDYSVAGGTVCVCGTHTVGERERER